MVFSLCSLCGPASTAAGLHRRPESVDTAPCLPAAPAAAAAVQRRRQWQAQRRGLRLRAAAYNSNPQNVDNPLVLPSPEFSPEEAVRVQLEALQRNDSPWANHGIQTAYEFANDVGGLDPSYYFGFRKDLYHFDHFLGMFGTQLPQLVNLGSFAITGCTVVPGSGDTPETAVVAVEVQHAQQPPAAFEFQLRRKQVGPRKGAWTTWAVLKAGECA